MARKRIVKSSSNSTIEEVIPRFITAKTAAGVSDSTIKTYRSHLSDFFTMILLSNFSCERCTSKRMGRKENFMKHPTL